MDSEANVVGVAQIINKADVSPGDVQSHVFSEQDVLVFRKYLMFCGIGITNAQLFQLSMHEYRCNQVSVVATENGGQLLSSDTRLW